MIFLFGPCFRASNIISSIIDQISVIIFIIGLCGLLFARKSRKKYWWLIVLAIVLYVGYALFDIVFGIGTSFCGIPKFQ